MYNDIGYIQKLVARLEILVGEVEEVEERENPRFELNLAKAIFLAEFVNNEMDLVDYHMDEGQRQEFLAMKIKRDGLYARLVKIQQEVGKEKVSQAMGRYAGYITRYAFD